MELIRDVYLHGALAERFGAHHRFVCATPAEALRALEANRPGFLEYLARAHEDGVAFQVLRGADSMTADDLGLPLGSEPFELAPVLMGAGQDDVGLGSIVVGTILVLVAVFGGPAGWAISGTAAGPLSAGVAASLLTAGIGLIAGGLAALLSPVAAFDANEDESAKNRASLFFSGARNTAAQGQPVPVLLGEHLAGSATISIGIRNEDRTREQIDAGE